jgi:hypothetical protein
MVIRMMVEEDDDKDDDVLKSTDLDSVCCDLELKII